MFESDAEAIERRRQWHLARYGYDRNCPKCGGWAKEIFYLPTPPNTDEINWQCEKCQQSGQQYSARREGVVPIVRNGKRRKK